MDEFIRGQQAARADMCEDNTATNMLTLLRYVTNPTTNFGKGYRQFLLAWSDNGNYLRDDKAA